MRQESYNDSYFSEAYTKMDASQPKSCSLLVIADLARRSSADVLSELGFGLVPGIVGDSRSDIGNWCRAELPSIGKYSFAHTLRYSSEGESA